jgi:ribose 5-phosphate isomerase B
VKLGVAADHAAFDAKEALKGALTAAGHEVIDYGTGSKGSCDYPDFASAVGRAVSSGEVELGYALCGTGIGAAIAANKLRGVRAAVVHDEYTARMSREHNDANVFCAGGRVLTDAELVRLALLWLTVPWAGGRHVQRLEKIRKLESP